MNKQELQIYANYIFNSGRQTFLLERMQLFNLINGEIFYPLRTWPKHLRIIFWLKPQSDNEAFQLFLHLYGNGCPPNILQKWILSSNYWSTTDVKRKRLYQLLWVYSQSKQGRKDNNWFFYDMEKKLYVYLNGKIK